MRILKPGSKGPGVEKLQKGLTSLGFSCGKPDGIYGDKTEDAVEAFQEMFSLYADGIFGRASAAVYNEKVDEEFRVELEVPIPEAISTSVKRLKFKRVPADTMNSNGFSSMTMREDAAVRYLALREECLALGGGITTAGSVRDLSAGGGAAQSATSLHYLGIAWDLALGSGMQSLANPFIIVNEGDRNWRVWMRCADGAVPTVTLQATLCTTQNKRTHLSEREVSGPYVDFTSLAAKYGFRPIRGKKKFFTGGSYSGAEWWHFQCNDLLVPHVSTFGAELLKSYDIQTIQREFCGNWADAHHAVWKETWF